MVKRPVGRPRNRSLELSEVQADKENVQVAPVLANREEPTSVKVDASTLGSKSSMLFHTLDTMKKGSSIFHERTSRGGWTFVSLELL